MANDLKRMNYYNGLFLKEEDFQLEQEYHVRLQRLHGRYMHNQWGIMEGLAVSAEPGTKRFNIQNGLAVVIITTADNEEHAVELLLPDNNEFVDLSDESSFPLGGTVYITISYQQTIGDDDPDKGDYPIHIIERPKIQAATTDPGSGSKSDLVLATVNIPNDTNWTSDTAGIINTDRRKIIDIGDNYSLDSADGSIKDVIYVDNSGNVGIGTNTPANKLEVNGTVKGQDAVFGGDCTVQGNLTVQGDYITVNTQTVEVEDNIIRVNKYTPQATPKVINGGLEVFRGGTAPNAHIIWDETADHWKIGLEGSLVDIAYGPDWDTLTDNSLADSLHRHGKLVSPDGSIDPALSVSNSGNVGIGIAAPTQKLDVNGTIKATSFVGDGSGLTGIRESQWLDGTAAIYYNVGNVGIGTTSPDGLLHLSRTNVGALQLIKMGNQNQPAREWSLDVDGSANMLINNEGGGTRFTAMVVNNAGNVGIGTDAPTQKLDVNGTIKATSFVGDGSALTGISAGKWLDGPTGGAIYYDAGNVGIGPSDPGYKLEVGSVDETNNYIRVRSSSWAGLLFYDGSGTHSGGVSYYHGDDSLLFQTKIPAGNPVERMRITTDGNVGIGVTAPTQKLEVNGTIKATSFVGDGSALTGISAGKWLDGPTGGAIYYDAGNVGIGTTSPIFPFHQVGGDHVIEDADIVLRRAGMHRWRLQETSTAGFQIKQVYNDAGTNVNSSRFSITDAGDVGIGTDAPAQKLQVSGAAQLGDTNGTNGGLIVYGPFNTATADGGVVVRASNSTIRLRLDNNEIDCTSYLYLNYYSKRRVYVGSSGATEGLYVYGNLHATGTITAGGDKSGYVTDRFVNQSGETVEQGDVVVLGSTSAKLRYGVDDNIPVPEVDHVSKAYDRRVCGIVAEILVEDEPELPEGEKSAMEKARAGAKGKARKLHDDGIKRLQVFSAKEKEKIDKKKIAKGQVGKMVTLGCFSHCKVDADIAPVNVGDLLTTSPTKGHAQKVLEPEKAVGAIIGKALGSLKKGKGKIPVMVMLH